MDSKASPVAINVLAELEKRMFDDDIYFSEDADLRLEIEIRLLRIIANLARTGEQHNQLFYEAEKTWNIHILPCSSNYSYKSPIPKVSELPDKLWDKQYNAGIDWTSKGLHLQCIHK